MSEGHPLCHHLQELSGAPLFLVRKGSSLSESCFGNDFFLETAVALSTAPSHRYLSFPELVMHIVYEKRPLKVVIKSLKYFSRCLFFLPLHQTLPLKELALRVTAADSRPGCAHPAGARNA